MENPISGTGVPEFDAGGDRQDELFDALSNSRRRFLLHSLQASEPPVSVAELTTELVAWEAQRPAADRSADDEGAVELSLSSTTTSRGWPRRGSSNTTTRSGR